MTRDRYLHTVFDVAPKLRNINIPLSTVIERGDLTVRQSLIRYLVDHPGGPRLEPREAAAALGTTMDSLTATLSHARRKAGEPAGGTARTS